MVAYAYCYKCKKSVPCIKFSYDKGVCLHCDRGD